MHPDVCWSHCRLEGCRKKLSPSLQLYGFCNAEHRALHQEEKEVHMKHALQAFRREGEPNRGNRA